MASAAREMLPSCWRSFTVTYLRSSSSNTASRASGSVKARAIDRATLGGTESWKAPAWGRGLGILGLCLAASATISVAVYGVLTAVD